MIRRANIVTLALIAGLSSFVVAPITVHAAEPNQVQSESILLSPTSKRHEVKAGDTKRDSFKIFNDGTIPITFLVYARPYSVANENYEANFDTESRNADAYKWVQFDTTSFDLEPGKSTDVNYTLRVPTDAAPGGHYGVLFAETQPTSNPTGTAIAQKKRVGAILYATVDGELTTSGSFLGADTPLFQSKAPLKIRMRVENKGNSDFIVQNSVRVSDIFGGLKFKNEKESVVLPSTTRAIVNDWANPAWIGVYKVEQTAKFLDTDRSVTKYVVFVPVWVYLAAFILIGARVLYAVAQRKHKK